MSLTPGPTLPATHAPPGPEGTQQAPRLLAAAESGRSVRVSRHGATFGRAAPLRGGATVSSRAGRRQSAAVGAASAVSNSARAARTSFM